MGTRRRLIDDIFEALMFFIFFIICYFLVTAICFVAGLNPWLGYVLTLICLVVIILNPHKL